MPSYTITKYTINIYPNAATIVLYYTSGLLGTIYFRPQGSTLKAPYTDSSGQVKVDYYLEQYLSVIDLLRNETPLNVFYSPPTFFIGCIQEAVGEGETHSTA